METTRIAIILIMGLMAFAVRAGPQLFFVGRKFPEAWDRLLRYLSYAFICSIISVTLFMTGARFETQVAPYRGAALAVTIIIAHKTKSPVTGMIIGTIVLLLLDGCGSRADATTRRSSNCSSRSNRSKRASSTLLARQDIATFPHRADQTAIEHERNRRNQDHRQDDIAGGGNESRRN